MNRGCSGSRHSCATSQPALSIYGGRCHGGRSHCVGGYPQTWGVDRPPSPLSPSNPRAPSGPGPWPPARVQRPVLQLARGRAGEGLTRGVGDCKGPDSKEQLFLAVAAIDVRKGVHTSLQRCERLGNPFMGTLRVTPSTRNLPTHNLPAHAYRAGQKALKLGPRRGPPGRGAPPTRSSNRHITAEIRRRGLGRDRRSAHGPAGPAGPGSSSRKPLPTTKPLWRAAGGT